MRAGGFLFWRFGWFFWGLGVFLVPFLFLLAPFSSCFESLGGFPGAWGSFCVPFLRLLVHFVFSVLQAVGEPGVVLILGAWVVFLGLLFSSCVFLFLGSGGCGGLIFLFRGRGRFSWGSGVPSCSFLVSSCSFFLLDSASCFGGLLGGFPGVFGFFLCSFLVSSCSFLLLGILVLGLGFRVSLSRKLAAQGALFRKPLKTDKNTTWGPFYGQILRFLTFFGAKVFFCSLFQFLLKNALRGSSRKLEDLRGSSRKFEDLRGNSRKFEEIRENSEKMRKPHKNSLKREKLEKMEEIT